MLRKRILIGTEAGEKNMSTKENIEEFKPEIDSHSELSENRIEDLSPTEEFVEEELRYSTESIPTEEGFDSENKKSDSNGIVQKFLDLPLFIKVSIVVVIIGLYMMKDEFTNTSKTEAPVLVEANETLEQEVTTDAEPPKVEEKLNKLNSCLIAAPISFKFENGGMTPYFGSTEAKPDALFCDEFSLKNNKIDPSGNNLSIVADIYSGTMLVKHVSLDPLVYFKPNYYTEGIGMKHPKTGEEVIYMAGDFLLNTEQTKLLLIKVREDATAGKVYYEMDYNGVKTAIAVDRKYVQ